MISANTVMRHSEDATDPLHNKSDSFQRGYNYVKKALSKDPASRDGLLRQADNPFDFGDFERGMLAALR